MMVRFSVAVLLLTACIFCTDAFVVSPSVAVGSRASVAKQNDAIMQLNMVSTSTPSSSRNSNRRPKKSVQDRTQEEAVSLIRDVVQAVYEAGPRAGPARTLQAYLAVTRTIQDFLPQPGRPTAESFSIPVALRKLFERLGATYVKLGQFVASSPTLFPKEYVLEFQKCLDATEPLPWDVIKRVIETELGPISKTFASIDQTPLASASIAQVHAAKLKTGEDVVIKVQKPRIDESLKADLSFIYVASRVLEFLQPDWERTSLSAIAGDIRSSMLEELDFEKEATNVEEFRQFLAENNLLKVATAPRIYRKYHYQIVDLLLSVNLRKCILMPLVYLLQASLQPKRYSQWNDCVVSAFSMQGPSPALHRIQNRQSLLLSMFGVCP
jgi:hypothetical protein